ncbi:MAG: class I SAM-dependent methyltransferase [Gaiellaceae bacterium]
MSTIDQLLEEASSVPVEGWDFTRLGVRISTKPGPWNFEQIVIEHVRDAADLLDMGTGGGEWLALLPYRPSRTVATEAWPPNVDVARARLRPLGISVVSVEGAPDNAGQQPDEKRGRLPFPTASFDLVSNRHDSFLASEVARVLTPGGTFLTQQTGGNYGEFYDALELSHPSRPALEWSLSLAAEQIRTAGLSIADSAEGAEETTFADVGALAWYLRAIPWVVEGFSVDTHRPQLERLDERIRSEGPIRFRQPSFWLKAIKPE